MEVSWTAGSEILIFLLKPLKYGYYTHISYEIKNSIVNF